MAAPLLATKLHVPTIRSDLVPRPRLIERLETACQRQLTLVSAPAGYGKTTLIVEGLTGMGRPLAWLSLDEEDNDPARFLAYLLAALQRIDLQIGRSARPMQQAPQPPSPQSLLMAMINDIAVAPGPFVLVLDDYHLIHTLAIHEQLAYLLAHQPAQMHLVIASREDPPLPLSRLRARGQMVEIRQADLQFTTAETAAFLCRAMQLELSADEIAALQQRTEGWIAGLQLVALSIRGRDDPRCLIASFTGTHRYILDYLIEEVFQRQPAHVRDFLLKASILDRFTAPLCDAVTGRENSGDILRSLEQGNLFIVPLDESRQWYRFHHLFADLLRERMRMDGRQDPVAELHRRASRWYEAEGFLADAVRHALAAADWQRAADLILGTNDELLRQGQLVTLLGWYRALPAGVVRANPSLCLAYAWSLILVGQADAAERYLDLAERRAERPDDAAFLGGVAAARAYLARLRGDNAGVVILSERALSLLPRENLAARAVVAVNLGLAQWYQGRLTEAQEALTEAEEAGRRSGNAYARWAAFTFLGRIQVARGRLRVAAERCRRMTRQGGQSSITCLAHFDLGRLLYEWDELEAAAGHLERGIALAHAEGSAEFEAGGLSTLAYVRQAQRQPSAAQDALARTDRLLERSGISPSTRLHNLAARAAVALAQGDLDAAYSTVERCTGLEEAGSFPDYLCLMLARARVLLALGQQGCAAAHLASLCRTASGAGWRSTVTQACALQALAEPDPGRALALLSEALTLAEPEGYVRTFVDSGAPMAALLRQAAGQGLAPGYIGRLLAAFGSEAQGLSTPPRAAGPSLPVEPLSARELEVLERLVAGCTYQEIALALRISINTVKTHLKHIYGKLGVRDRREAAARAQALGLVG